MSPTSRHKKVAKELSAAKKQALVAKLLGNSSCRNCQYLYAEDYGYSNYTVTDTYIRCALDKNPYLVNKDVDMPWDFNTDEARGINDRWPPTCNSACERFCARGQLPMAKFDVDGAVALADVTGGFSPLARKAIARHRGRG